MEKFGVSADYSSPAGVMEEIARLTPIYGGIRYHRLGIAGLQWPCPAEDHPGTGVMHVEKFPIGRARLRPVEHQEPCEAADQDYPFLLTTGRSLYHFHTGTMTRRTSLLDREVPNPALEVNPQDAKQLGIRSGQRVTVESRRGKVCLEAKVTACVPAVHWSKSDAAISTAGNAQAFPRVYLAFCPQNSSGS